MEYPKEFQEVIVKNDGAICKAVFIWSEAGLPLFLAIANHNIRELKNVTEWKPSDEML